VFIDPGSTGFSRPVRGEDPNSSMGTNRILRASGFQFASGPRAIRGGLPLRFLVGESYGTTRAAGLSQYLQDRYGLYVNGSC